MAVKIGRFLVLSVTWMVLVSCGSTVTGSSLDATVGVDATLDVASAETVANVDVGTVEADLGPAPCEAGTGCFGETCEGADDCHSGICANHLGDQVCSKTCDAECPSGWDCTLVGGASDGQYVCVSNFSMLCLPCATHEGCLGDTPSACVQYASGLSFCGGACDLAHPCPEGYDCQEVDTAGGATSYQCLANAGVCACAQAAIDSALTTPCQLSNEHGTCEGVRACAEEGLLACDAATPAAEVCNGLDDDCNGLTDEDLCDDGNPCTEDLCLGEEGCQHTPLNKGECLDGDACTQADHCEAGVCVGESLQCNDANPCTDDVCDQDLGCTYQGNFLDCDDGDACTLGDSCKEGACASGVALSCDDGNACTDDACGLMGCEFTPNIQACDDGNACSALSQCKEGSCQAQVSLDCDDDNLCTNDGCNPSGGCLNVPNLLPCTDGDACTLTDVCLSGSCESGAPASCDDGNACTDDACTGGGCVFVPNAESCDDGNACTFSDGCMAGTCAGVGVVVCDDANPCTQDSCLLAGGCTHEVVQGACSDGDACTLGDTCTNGACESGALAQCNDANPCTTDSCQGGDCIFSPAEGACEDGNACTDSSACQGGNCVATLALDCQDNNPCTNDGCDPSQGCIHAPNSLPCTDGDGCTLSDSCVAGECLSGSQALCDDGNPCTDDACTDGACVFSANTAPCNDGNACTAISACSGGACLGTDAQVCQDDNGCTNDGCDPLTGCTFTANTAPCSDDNVCTLGDVCLDLGCQPGLGIFPCDDGNACNGLEDCAPDVGCQSGDPVALDDGVACTIDSCDAATGTITHVAQDTACDDGDACTGEETCHPQNGCQAGTPLVCTSVPNAEVTCDALCVISSCQEGFDDCDGDYANGCEANLLSDVSHCGSCDDACGGGGTCEAGVCLSYQPGFKVYSVPGAFTFTPGPGVTSVRVAVVGGGGGGPGSHYGGGGSGWVRYGVFSDLGASVSVVVGNGGNGGVPDTNEAPAADGAPSNFGNLLLAPGGFGGKASSGSAGGSGGSGGGGAGNGGCGGQGGSGGAAGASGCTYPGGDGGHYDNLSGMILNMLTAGAGGAAGQSSHSGGGGAGGVLIAGTGTTAGNGGASFSGKGGVGHGAGGGAGGYNGSRPAGGTGAAGVVYIEW